jgi:purine-nucleoside phosphorylase
LRLGIYLAVSGPSYETPAEIRAFRSFGADAVGMSTVPEAIVARQCGLRVAGLSCITNLAAGLSKTPLSHHEVLETASRAQVAAGKMLSQFVALYERGNKVSD